MPTSSVPDDRVEHVESLLMQLQHEFDLLGQVVWRQQTEIDTLKKELQRLDERLVTAAEGPEVRDPQAEQPPHY
ncbi:MAG TPA: SlyX family protein [Planctomycetaceae bacterium]|nr:SlyX family protein [Planctomycetaceae bacterium]